MKNLENLGKYGLLGLIAENNKIKQSSTVSSIGDDAAVIDCGKLFGLLNTDLLLEGIHFDLGYTPLQHLGYKTVAIGVSNIAAMNGIPSQVAVSLGLSNRFDLEAVQEFYKGVNTACEAYNVDLVGSNTSSSRTGLHISVTTFGFVEKDKIVYRNNPNENDILCVTGDLGSAYMGLQVLEREKQEFLANPKMQPQMEDKTYLVARQLKIEARTDIIHELREKNVVPTSMIDISDSLASDILQLNKASGKGFSVFFENIPIENLTLQTATEFNINPIVAVMNGGDDYELLMTFKQADFEKVKEITEITPIGYVTSKPENWLILNSGEKTKITSPGWEQ